MKMIVIMQLSLSDRWDYMECDSPPLSIDGHLSVPCLYFQRIYIGSSHHNSSTLHQSPTLLTQEGRTRTNTENNYLPICNYRRHHHHGHPHPRMVLKYNNECRSKKAPWSIESTFAAPPPPPPSTFTLNHFTHICVIPSKLTWVAHHSPNWHGKLLTFLALLIGHSSYNINILFDWKRQ